MKNTMTIGIAALLVGGAGGFIAGKAGQKGTDASATEVPLDPATLIAHGAPLVRPKATEKFDFEGELAVIIGRGGRTAKRTVSRRRLRRPSCG